MNMDRFKFRVWDTKNKRYGLSPYTRRIGDIITIIEPPASDNQFIIEQCTGLKDKNGKLIYEGDALGGSNGSINGIEWPYKTTVTWDAGQHRFTMPNWAWNDNGEYEGGRTHYVEIIGNIHESEAKSE